MCVCVCVCVYVCVCVCRCVCDIHNPTCYEPILSRLIDIHCFIRCYLVTL